MTHPTITGIRITATKEVSEVTLSSLADFQAAVDGDIEAVGLSDGSTLYINENGRIIGLPFNSIATDVCGLGGLPHLMLQGILGDVVLVGPLDGRGYDTNVTDKGRNWVQRVAREA